MRLRKQSLGTRNICGHRIETTRKNQGIKQKELLARLQVAGININASALSKLEGQIRMVTDFELVAISDALGVSINYLMGREGR